MDAVAVSRAVTRLLRARPVAARHRERRPAPLDPAGCPSRAWRSIARSCRLRSSIETRAARGRLRPADAPRCSHEILDELDRPRRSALDRAARRVEHGAKNDGRNIPAARQHLIDAIVDPARAVASRSRTAPPASRSCSVLPRRRRGRPAAPVRPRRSPRPRPDTLSSACGDGPANRWCACSTRTQTCDGWTQPSTIVEVVTDDMPFLVDSLAMVLNACGVAIHLMVHPVLRVRATGAGACRRSRRTTASRRRRWSPGSTSRSTGSQQRPGALEELRRRILEHARGRARSPSPTGPACARARDRSRSEVLPACRAFRAASEVEEASEFLEWLADNHFTFLGYREYRLERGRASDRLVPVPRRGLGLLRAGDGRPRPQADRAARANCSAARARPRS